MSSKRAREKAENAIDESYAKKFKASNANVNVFASYISIPLQIASSKEAGPKFLPRVEECEEWKKDLERYREIITILQSRVGNIDGIIEINGLIISYERIICWQNVSVFNQLNYNTNAEYTVNDSFRENEIEELYFEEGVIKTGVKIKLNNDLIEDDDDLIEDDDDWTDVDDSIRNKIADKILLFDCNSIRIDLNLGSDRSYDYGKISKYRYFSHESFFIADFYDLINPLCGVARAVKDIEPTEITIENITLFDNNDIVIDVSIY